NEQITWIASLGINYSLGVDGISLLLVTLTTLLTLVCIGASFRIEQKVKNYMAFMLLLECGIIGVFLSTNLFLFYIFWEVMLIPAYFLVGGWGGDRRIYAAFKFVLYTSVGSLLMQCGIIGVFLSTNLFLFYIFWEVMLIPAYFLVGGWGGDRRIYAAFKFVLYTSVGSLLMLAGIIALSYYHHQAAGGNYTLDLASLLNSRLDNTVQMWLLLAFAAAFVVKVPLVPFHSWLPDTYSEAPAPVTAMLAGAMSKTGAYGFLRFCLPLFPQAIHTLAPLFNSLAVISILYCAVLALVQTDLKRLLGYSSISHLGIVMLGIFAFNTQGIEGSVLQMVNHGITITALFLIVGFIEARTGTRNITDLGGMARRVPILATVMLIAVLSSLGLPGLNNFAGEFLTLLGAFRANAVFGVLGTLVVIPAAWYLIRFFLEVMEGPSQKEGVVSSLERKGKLYDLQFSEFLPLAPLLLLIFYIGIQPAPLTFLMEPSVVNTLQNLSSAFIR
ncbi:MAG: NADH-quinone oxidoreductase subunit M, partial [Chloroflexi bacterium]